MSKDCHHNNILQESLQKVEQEEEEGFEKDEEKGAEEEEEGFEKDEEKGAEEEEEGFEKDEEKGGEEGVGRRKDVEEEEEEACKTPSSSDHKIPTSQSCPPTPKKKVRVNSHKRKLSELQFFENTRSEEVESFFLSNSEPFTTIESRSTKRRCRSA
ncbi:hypothetical protein REPUB_Repub11eG0144000 [Reevesia pubescens]